MPEETKFPKVATTQPVLKGSPSWLPSNLLERMGQWVKGATETYEEHQFLEQVRAFPEAYPEHSGLEVPEVWQDVLDFYKKISPSEKFQRLDGKQQAKVRQAYFTKVVLPKIKPVKEEYDKLPTERRKEIRTEAMRYYNYFQPSFADSFVRGLVSWYITPGIKLPPQIKPRMPVAEFGGSIIGGVIPYIIAGKGVEKLASGPGAPRMLASPGATARTARGSLTFMAAEVPRVATGSAGLEDIFKAGLYGASFAGPLSATVATVLTGGLATIIEGKQAGLQMGVMTGVLRGMGAVPKVRNLALQRKANKLALKAEMSDYYEGMGTTRPTPKIDVPDPELLANQLAESRLKLVTGVLRKIDGHVKEAEQQSKKVGLRPRSLESLRAIRDQLRIEAERGNQEDFLLLTNEFFSEMDAVAENVNLKFTRSFEDATVSLTPQAEAAIEAHPGTPSTKLLQAMKSRQVRVNNDIYRTSDDIPTGDSRVSELDRYIADQLAGRGKTMTLVQLQEQGISPDDLPGIIRVMRERNLLSVETTPMDKPLPTEVVAASVYHDALDSLPRKLSVEFGKRMRGLTAKEHLPLKTQRKLWLEFENDLNKAVAKHWKQFTEEKVEDTARALEEIDKLEVGEAEKFGLTPNAYLKYQVKMGEWRARLAAGEEPVVIQTEVMAEKIPAALLPEELKIKPLTPTELKRASSRARVEADAMEIPEMPEEARALAPEELAAAAEAGKLPAEVRAAFTAGKGEPVPIEMDPHAIINLLERKGISGRWDSATRMLTVGGKEMKISDLEKIPDAGETTTTGELVITLYDGYAILKKGDHWTVKESPGLKRSGGPLPRNQKDILDLMYSQGYVVEWRTPDGGWRMWDIYTGQMKDYTPAEIEAMILKPRPIPNLTPEVEVKPDPTSFNSENVSKAPTDVLPKHKLLISRVIKPRKQRFSMYQDIFKVPIHEAAYHSETGMERQLIRVRNWNRPATARANNIMKSIDRDRYWEVMDYVRSPYDPLLRAKVIERSKLTREELAAAHEVEALALEVFGPKYNELLSAEVPDYLSTGEMGDMLRMWKGQYGFRPEYITDLRNFLRNTVASKVRQMVSPQMERLGEVMQQVEDLPISRETKNKMLVDIRYYRDRSIAGMLGDREFTSNLIKQMNEKFKLELRGTVPDRLLGMYLMATYSSTMPLRLGLVVRNAFQPHLTTGLYVGKKYLAMGYRRAFTKEGIALARELNPRDPQIVAFEEALPKREVEPAPGIKPRGVGRRVVRAGIIAAERAPAITRQFYDPGMKPYFGVDRGNLSVSANAGWEAVMNEGPRLLRGEISLAEFKRNTGIVFFEGAAKNEILAPLVDFKTESLVPVAKRYAWHLQEDTQWIYRSANAPWVFEKMGRWGRLAGQFGIWPASYVQFFKRGLRSGDAVATERFLGRWAFANAALYTIGREVFGVDLRTWIATGPLTYSGGPFIQAAATAIDLSRSLIGAEWRREMALREAGQVLLTMVPGRSAARDIMRALEEEEPEEAVKRILGLRTYPPKKRRR